MIIHLNLNFLCFCVYLIGCTISQNEILAAFYGASVTNQKGYVEQFQKLMNWTTIKFSWPGAGLNLCNLETILDKSPNYVFLDWSLHSYSGNPILIKNIIWRILNASAVPIFIHLPRTDANSGSKSVIGASFTIKHINIVADELNVSVYDLREKITIDELKNGLLRDNVHTLTLGAERYAKELKHFILNMPPKIPIFFTVPNEYECFPKFIPTNILAFKSLKFVLNGTILGMNVRVGPNSNFVDLISDRKNCNRLNLWDEYCHYYREKFALGITTKTLSKIEIRVLNLNFTRESCRRPFNFNQTEILIPTLEIKAICYIGELDDIRIDDNDN